MDRIEWESKIAENFEAVLFNARKQFGVGLAEAVDGLGRIPDDEAGAALAIGPGGNEAAEQLVLTAAGVLEFIHEKMANSVGDGQSCVRRKSVCALEHAEGNLRHFSEVGSGRFGEDDAKLSGRVAQEI